MEEYRFWAGPLPNTPYIVHFSKTSVCMGESLKVVALTWNEYKRKKFTLKLHSLNDFGSNQLIREEVLITGPQKFFGPYRHTTEIQANANDLVPGLYHAEVYLLPDAVHGSEADQYLVGEHSFQVVSTEEYVRGVRDMFGGVWDEPVYLDSSEIGQVNDFFLSWDLHPLSEYIISLKDKKADTETNKGIGRASNAPNDFKEHLLDKLQDLIAVSMSRDSPIPFRLVKYFDVKDELPHIDLTKCFWLLSVLGETWVDALFFSTLVSSKIYTAGDTLSILLEPHIENNKMPFIEPIMFQIIRETIGGDLNFELIYDSDRGINLLVKQTHTFLSKGAGGLANH